MLKKNEFAVLAQIARFGSQSQRLIAKRCDISLGSVNKALQSLLAQGFVDNKGAITTDGFETLQPYKVENAIIMAAGMSTRFAPISYEQPKGLLEVHGEVLIERQIRQLQEVGINDITVVVGYMKEQFFYLEDEFGVKIRINEQYATRNNNSTLMLVRKELGNTYICSSDDYFSENVFEPYVYCAYYSAIFFAGETGEYCLTVGPKQRIMQVTIGGRDSYGMLGHVYFDRAFSKRFVEILEEEYDRPETAPKLWEDIYSDHIDELDMVIRKYDESIIHEFDSLSELSEFDPQFIQNVDSAILDNICIALDVERGDIANIEPLNKGLTNLSFTFLCKGTAYVYRHPGFDTEGTIVRASEEFSECIARNLGLDSTFVYEDPEQGWKISRFIENASGLDYHNEAQVSRALEMARILHGCGVVSKWSYDVYENTLKLVEVLDMHRRASFKDYGELSSLIDALHDYVKADGTETCLCHNDFYAPNFLVADGAMSLIDWEYSGMSDYASDLGTFICCSDYSFEEALEIFRRYFQCEPTAEQLAHCLSYVAICSYHWFIWALYKDACGASVGESLYLWYKSAKLYGERAQTAIQGLSGLS